MPTKLVGTCEQTLVKRKEIIETLESMTTKKASLLIKKHCLLYKYIFIKLIFSFCYNIYILFQDISLCQLLKKIKEFNAENEMLACSLERVKNEFFTELNDVVAFIRFVFHAV